MIPLSGYHNKIPALQFRIWTTAEGSPGQWRIECCVRPANPRDAAEPHPVLAASVKRPITASGPSVGVIASIGLLDHVGSGILCELMRWSKVSIRLDPATPNRIDFRFREADPGAVAAVMRVELPGILRRVCREFCPAFVAHYMDGSRYIARGFYAESRSNNGGSGD